MKIVYTILAILLLAFFNSFFDIQKFITLPLVMFVVGLFCSNLFKLRKRGNTPTTISLVLFLVCYVSLVFISSSEILLWISCALGSILGLLIGAAKLSSLEEDMR